MLILYQKWKNYSENPLTKNKMDLNYRKMKNQPPSPEFDQRVKRVTQNGTWSEI